MTTPPALHLLAPGLVNTTKKKVDNTVRKVAGFFNDLHVEPVIVS
jgi:hypothetical protein